MEHSQDFEQSTDVTMDYAEPPMYKVVMYNDDYTPMDFVVDILTGVFRRSRSEAEKIMMAVHKTGKGIAGIYPYDIAATKTAIAMRKAREQKYPFRCSVEKN
ncbi:MAG: ATP-dependent Clp protease adaptor ClpS [Treponema sp.]|nr:ATP-dependent Clp protease adaptor ClpS [Treponema sp.]